jgi:hypothetical protein
VSHWSEQIKDLGGQVMDPDVMTQRDGVQLPPARKADPGCGSGKRREIAAKIESGGTLPFDLRAVNWVRVMHLRVTWWALLVWAARLPLRLPLRIAFWAGRWWIKFKLRRHAERGPRADTALVDSRIKVCEACEKLEGVGVGWQRHCGACSCPKTPRSSLNQTWHFKNYRCPLGRWDESYAKWVVFSFTVLNASCKTCGTRSTSNG